MRLSVLTFALGAVAALTFEHVANTEPLFVRQAIAQSAKPAPETACEMFENPTLNGMGGWVSRMGSKGYKVTAMTTAPSPMGGAATYVAVACK
jgi:hypothetical protein